MERVFVYGILMPDATEAATLPGYRLAFSGHATVRPLEGSAVLGGLVDVDAYGLRRYDSIEGLRPDGTGYYRRERRIVNTANGPVEAWVYMMNERYFEETDASDWLVARFEKQYERLGHIARVEEGAIAR